MSKVSKGESESLVLDLLLQVPRLISLALVGTAGIWLAAKYDGAVSTPSLLLYWTGVTATLLCCSIGVLGEIAIYIKIILTDMKSTEPKKLTPESYKNKKPRSKTEQKKTSNKINETLSRLGQAPLGEELISSALTIDQLRLDLGNRLLTLVNNESGFRLTEQIKALRRQLAIDMGFVMPSVRIMDNMQLPANTYALHVKEIEVGRGDIRPGMLLIMDPEGQPVQIPGEATTDPAFGLPATWVDASAREEANFRGYTVVDATTVITTHLTEVIKDNMSELLSYAETQKLLDDLSADHQKLVTDIVPNQISTSGIQRVLQTLLTERISIRDLPTILEGIAEATGFTKNVVSITEHVRTRLGRQLCAAYSNHEGLVPLITLSPEWEQAFAESLIGQGEEKQLVMRPDRLQDFIKSVRKVYDQQADRGESPVMLTSPMVRPYVRSIIERFRPSTVVMSQNEIPPQASVRTLGQV